MRRLCVGFLGALGRLGEPGVDRQELKKIRLVISGLKTYCAMWVTWQDIAAVEEKIRNTELAMLSILEGRVRVAETEEEREKLREQIEKMREDLGEEYKKNQV